MKTLVANETHLPVDIVADGPASFRAHVGSREVGHYYGRGSSEAEAIADLRRNVSIVRDDRNDLIGMCSATIDDVWERKGALLVLPSWVYNEMVAPVPVV